MSARKDNRSGFTLVEMITVILIMAILIGVVSTGLNTARENVWRTRARDTARQLVDAWNLYLLDHRSFPSRDTLGMGNELGIPATIKALEPLRPEKGSKYIDLSFDEAYRKNRAGKEIKKTGKEDALVDHWGGAICFELDFDYDGFCEAPAFIPTKQSEMNGEGNDKRGKTTVKANAVAWSMGPPARKGKKWVAAWK